MALKVGNAIDLTELDKTLAHLGTLVKDWRPVWARIDVDLTEQLRKQFETRGAHWDTPWADLSPATVRVRIARRMFSRGARKVASAAAGRDTPLRDTNGLWASWTKPGAPGSIRVMDALEYQRGTSYSVGGFPVALAMQQGFKSTHRPLFDRNGDVMFVKRKGGPKKVPARPVVPAQFPAPVLKAWEGHVVQFIEHGTVN